MAKKKEGQIAIIPVSLHFFDQPLKPLYTNARTPKNYIDETELLLTTGLTTEDWSRDMPGQGR